MARKRYKPEKIIQILGEIELLTSQGSSVPETAQHCGIVEQTYYRWRREYGGMDKSEVRRLKELEQENARLKKLVAELSLDKAILEEAVSKKRPAQPYVARGLNMCRVCWASPNGARVGCSNNHGQRSASSPSKPLTRSP